MKAVKQMKACTERLTSPTDVRLGVAGRLRVFRELRVLRVVRHACDT